MFTKLTKYIEIFKNMNGNYGEWKDGAVEYVASVNEFAKDVYAFSNNNKKYKMDKYKFTLLLVGVNGKNKNIEAIEVGKVKVKVVLALLMAVINEERFSEGTTLEYLKNGCIIKWLERLEELDK